MTGAPLRVSFQMDSPESLNLAGDTTFAMALEAQRRGHELFWHDARSLSLVAWQAHAQVFPLRAQAEPEALESGNGERRSLSAFDVVLMRQDPPFDLGYITATYMLERVAESTLVLNDPRAVRDAPEKLLREAFVRHMPPTLISADEQEIRAFAHTVAHGIVLKPLYGHAGHGVVRLGADDPNLVSLLGSWSRAWAGPPVVQAFLPEIAEGDRRVVVIDGRGVGAINRRPAEGGWLGNLRLGARAEAAEMTAHEHAVVAEIGPLLAESGILLAGLDFIGDRLTEVNITSPTGFRSLEALSGVPASALFWDAVEARVAARKAGAERAS